MRRLRDEQSFPREWGNPARPSHPMTTVINAIRRRPEPTRLKQKGPGNNYQSLKSSVVAIMQLRL